jgi:predicted dehydrogenase
VDRRALAGDRVTVGRAAPPRLGVAIIGCGDIAGRYAEDIPRQSHLRLVGVSDLDVERAAAFAERHAARAYRSIDETLADPDVELVANLTSHRAHVTVSAAAIRAGRHVFSEKPMALTAVDAVELLRLAQAHSVRMASAPIVNLGEMAQTARRWVDDGRLGTVRLAWADVNWGRIERWHPAPQSFYDVGPLFDVGVYPLTLLTGLFGPVVRVRADARRLLSDRFTTSGDRFDVVAPDYVLASLDFQAGPVARLTVDFYVADPARQRGVELHGDAGSLWLSNWFQFKGSLEHAPQGEEYRAVPLLRQPEIEMPWAAGLEELAASILEERQPVVSGEHAAHVVDVMETVLRAAEAGTPLDVTSRFERPPAAAWAASLSLDGGP